MLPKTYCSKEEGDWKPWVHGNVEPAVLSRWNPDQDHIFVRGVQVFGFYFETEDGIRRRWTCKFGWETKGML